MACDITLPNGAVRHNVGSDNLSDEDRKAMELTTEQVAELNKTQPIPLLCRIGIHKKEWSLYAGWRWQCSRCPAEKFVGID